MARRKRCKSKQERRCCSRGKSTTKFRIGPITRNPFLNFLRDMRKAARSGMTITQLTARGAELWRKMNTKQKKPYCELAKLATKSKKKKRRHRRRCYSTDSSVRDSLSRSSSCSYRR